MDGLYGRRSITAAASTSVTVIGASATAIAAGTARLAIENKGEIATDCDPKDHLFWMGQSVVPCMLCDRHAYYFPGIAAFRRQDPAISPLSTNI